MLEKITTQNKYMYIGIATLLVLLSLILYMLWRDRQATRTVYTSTDTTMEQLETTTNNARNKLVTLGSQLDRAGETISSAEGTVSDLERTVVNSEVRAAKSKNITAKCLDGNRKMQAIIADIERANCKGESNTQKATLAE